MQHNPDRLVLWPGYFNSKLSRRKGRRVPKESSVPNPDLDNLAWAARQSGLRKMKREEGVSHPRRPYLKEGRLWISAQSANADLGTSNKEEVLQIIGGVWREQYAKRKEENVGTNISSKNSSSKKKSRQKISNIAAKRAHAALQKKSKKKRRR